jgi:hypothetical protein
MKTLIVSTLTLLSTVAHGTEPRTETKSTLIRVVEDSTNILLDSQTARCSDVGYGQLELKVTVPELAALAIYDHAGPGESTPCITAGRCRGANLPSRLIDPNNPMEQIRLKVIVKEVLSIDHDNKSCYRAVHEDVESEIRGIKFTHHREGGHANKPYEKCL